MPGAHYESAATRKYIHGRTETIRSCSNESVAFARAMLDKTKTDAEKVATLKEAIESHKKYCVEVRLYTLFIGKIFYPWPHTYCYRR